MYKPKTVRNIIKPIVVVALVAMTLAGLATSLVHTRAAAATYNVIVGTDTSYGLESLAFFPQTLKVHKGDTVTWQFRGFHNARFDQKPLDLVVVNDIDGKQLPEFNPAILFPNAKSGDAYWSDQIGTRGKGYTCYGEEYSHDRAERGRTQAG
jgi:plastocyanin